MGLSPNSDAPSFQLKSIWSKAGVGTCCVLEYISSISDHRSSSSSSSTKNFKVVFDIGSTPIFHDTISASHVVLSHGHIDHFGSMFSHARAHCLSFDTIPTYYVPETLLDKFHQAKDLFSEIDAACYDFSDSNLDNISNEKKRCHSLLQMNIVPVKAGVEIELKQKKIENGVQFYLRPFQVSHGGHPSLGYTLITRTTVQVLKGEYAHLKGSGIGQLAKNGIQVKETRVTERVEVCYSGDTNIHGILPTLDKVVYSGRNYICSNDADFRIQGFKEASIVLLELTYLDPVDRKLAEERGHMNIMEVSRLVESYGWSTTSSINSTELSRSLVFYHVSGKHKSIENILNILKEHLPEHIHGITKVAVSSFDTSSVDYLVPKDGCISLIDYTKCDKEY